MLLLIDVDGTLVDTSSARGNGLQAWRAAIEEGAFPPLPGVVDAVSALRTKGMDMMILTGRAQSLEAATRRWLRREIPALAQVPMLMRGDDDWRDVDAVKWDLSAPLGVYHRLWAIDDEPWCDGLPVRLFVAPGGWSDLLSTVN